MLMYSCWRVGISRHLLPEVMCCLKCCCLCKHLGITPRWTHDLQPHRQPCTQQHSYKHTSVLDQANKSPRQVPPHLSNAFSSAPCHVLELRNNIAQCIRAGTSALLPSHNPCCVLSATPSASPTHDDTVCAGPWCQKCVNTTCS
jgi:hypothetical protein